MTKFVKVLPQCYRVTIAASLTNLFGQDPLLQYFLTYSGEDHSTSIRDQFKHIPDEFVTSDNGYKARELTSPGLRASVSLATTRMAELARYGFLFLRLVAIQM